MPFNVRTIFLLIRGIDQSGRALSDASKATDNLAEKEKNLASASFRMLFAGAAFLAFGVMATGALLSTLSASTRGQRALDDFGKVVERVKKAFAEATINLFGEQIKDTIKQLDLLSKDTATMKLVTEIGWTVAIGSIIVGIAAIAGAGIAFIGNAIMAALFPGVASAATTFTATGVVGTGLSVAIPLTIGYIITWKIMDIVENQLGIKPVSLNDVVDRQFAWLTGGKKKEQTPNSNPGSSGLGPLGDTQYGNYANPSPTSSLGQTFNFYGGVNTKATKEELAPLFSDLMKDYIISQQGK